MTQYLVWLALVTFMGSIFCCWTFLGTISQIIPFLFWQRDPKRKRERLKLGYELGTKNFGANQRLDGKEKLIGIPNKPQLKIGEQGAGCLIASQ